MIKFEASEGEAAGSGENLCGYFSERGKQSMRNQVDGNTEDVFRFKIKIEFKAHVENELALSNRFALVSVTALKKNPVPKTNLPNCFFGVTKCNDRVRGKRGTKWSSIGVG